MKIARRTLAGTMRCEFDASQPEGFLVRSFANDGVQDCRALVRAASSAGPGVPHSPQRTSKPGLKEGRLAGRRAGRRTLVLDAYLTEWLSALRTKPCT